jgi:hypothetical protein
MTGFFASDLRPLASEPSQGQRFCVRRIICTINTPKMPEIKLNVTDADLARLNAEAAAHGIPRAHLIRQRALSGGVVAGLTTAAYHALVADACAFMRGDLNRRHVETLVAYVIAHSHSSQAATGDQSAA